MSKVALVTGASRGIGRAIAERLLKAGRTLLASARSESKLRDLAEAASGRVHIMPCDLSQPAGWSHLLDEVEARGFVLDELVLSAGLVQYDALGQVAEESLRAQLELNFVVPFMMSQRVGCAMRVRGGGAIVHVASTLGFRAAPQTAAYAASKAALLSATRSLALELAPHVRVNAVAPGVVDTDMVRVVRAAGSSSASERDQALRLQLEGLARLHPLQRLGTAEEVAEAVLYLLGAQWVTGSVLTIDGGLTAA